MPATSEPLQNTSMMISLALNVVFAFGIVMFLSDAKAQISNPRFCSATPTVVSGAEVAQAGKVRYTAPVEMERPSQLNRSAARPTTTGPILPVVSYIRCQSRVRTHNQ